MIARDERLRSTTEIYIAGVACDRCGNEVRQGTGFGMGDYPFDGTCLRGKLFPASGNLAELEFFEAELCGPCTRELIEWIGARAHLGLKGRDLVENVGDLMENVR